MYLILVPGRNFLPITLEVRSVPCMHSIITVEEYFSSSYSLDVFYVRSHVLQMYRSLQRTHTFLIYASRP